MEQIKPQFERLDSRGKLTQVLTQKDTQMNILDIKKGSQMGGHFHKKTNEIFVILDGWISLWTYKIGDKEALQTEFKKGDVFTIGINEWHAIEALSKSRLAVLLSPPYDPNSPDIHDGGLDGSISK